tara:strand:- start:7227 stop:7514 length:288 start_codon:yes stop_codon:yes gene_type:complete
MNNMSNNIVFDLVNELAALRAEKEKINNAEKCIVTTLKHLGVGVYQGEEHKAVVSEVTTERLDMKAVRNKLSPQFMRAHTKSSTTLKITLSGYNK